MSECMNCGADMGHSPCCGRAEELAKELRRLRQRVEELEKRVGEYREALHLEVLSSERLTTERDEYKDALVSIAEHWNRSENDKAMNDALYYMIDTADTALTRHADGRKEKDNA